jgi:ATP-dependent Lon protease
LADIPENIKNHLDIHPVQWIDEVLTLALASQPVPLPEKPEANEIVANEVQPTDKSIENNNTVIEAIKH